MAKCDPCGAESASRKTDGAFVDAFIFDSFMGVFAPQVIRIVGMALLTLHADRIAFPARYRQEALHAE